MSKKIRVCQCYDRWGEAHPDCEWSFLPNSYQQIYCPTCRPLAKRLQTKFLMVQKRTEVPLEELVESTDREWLASWIDRVCTCCGNKGVPVFNRYLCYNCWTNPPAEDQYLDYQVPAAVPTGAIRTTVLTADDYTQEELKRYLKTGCITK